MSEKSMRTLAVGLTVAIAVACTGAVLAYGTSMVKDADQVSFDAVPSFRILERTMGPESAVVSVTMGKLNATVAKKVAKYIVEEQLSNSRKEARIYFYREGAKIAHDEPQHEISWVARRGYTIEY